MSPAGRRRRIAHVVYSFSIGGLENVIVQLINRLPPQHFEHMVVSLTTISDFKNRIQTPGVQFVELNKSPGHAIPLYPRIFRLLREWSPDVVHTCNLAGLEIAPLAWLAGVPLRIQAEHGWDAHDPKGESRRYQRVRKLYKPFVSHYVAVSDDIDRYLRDRIGVSDSRRSLIENGVDTDTFAPAPDVVEPVPGSPFHPRHHWIVGTVGRLQTVKNQPLLARAFVRLIQQHPDMAERARLVIVGEGPLRSEVESTLAAAQLTHLAWLPGARSDVSHILRTFNVFVLPSQAEGTSCTLQEAMATALPVVATAVGGTPKLVEHGVTGWLVPPDDEVALAAALRECFVNCADGIAKGQRARRVAEQRYGLQAMVNRYAQLFDPRPAVGTNPATTS